MLAFENKAVNWCEILDTIGKILVNINTFFYLFLKLILKILKNGL
jgi:hypothetical protein